MPQEKFDPEAYYGQGTGTGIFLSCVFPPALPRDTTYANYLKPHRKFLEQLRRSSTPSVLFVNSPAPPSSRTYIKSHENLQTKPRPTLPPHAPRSTLTSLRLSSSSSHSQNLDAIHYHSNLQDALNASTVNNVNAEDDEYLKEFMDRSSQASPSVSRKTKRRTGGNFDGVYLPRLSKKVKLNPSTSSHGVGNNASSGTSKQTSRSYIPGDLIPTEKKSEKADDGYVQLYVGELEDFISSNSRTGWSGNGQGSSTITNTNPLAHLLPNSNNLIPSSSSKQKQRESQRQNRLSLVKTSNTRHIEMELDYKRRQGELGTLGTTGLDGIKRGLPPGLNSRSIGFGSGFSVRSKGKERDGSSSDPRSAISPLAPVPSGWAERMFASIVTGPETTAGFWIGQNSDDVLFPDHRDGDGLDRDRDGDEDDDEGSIEISEVHTALPTSTSSSTHINSSSASENSSSSAMSSITFEAPRASAKTGKSEKQITTSFPPASSSFISTPILPTLKSTLQPRSPPLKALKRKKSPVALAHQIASTGKSSTALTASPIPISSMSQYHSPSSQSQPLHEFSSVPAPTPFSTPVCPSSLSAVQPKQFSNNSHEHQSLPQAQQLALQGRPSEKALGKRKANSSDDSTSGAVTKRGRPTKPRPASTLPTTAISTTRHQYLDQNQYLAPPHTLGTHSPHNNATHNNANVSHIDKVLAPIHPGTDTEPSEQSGFRGPPTNSLSRIPRAGVSHTARAERGESLNESVPPDPNLVMVVEQFLKLQRTDPKQMNDILENLVRRQREQRSGSSQVCLYRFSDYMNLTKLLEDYRRPPSICTHA
ncbi:hypothetical protein J3R30DRAFT_1584138 [Lentinula aciculospora]|uniref:Uncharacterized protein n=1 Tax=Lentinula aciculospora TaxID=153920 RepID=A0A9W9DHC2_9AGAR|nr:hypothetical protein J3R30DRAFT_1584138 [Lentinula aciculospora]